MEHNQKVEDYMRIIYRLRENGLVRGAFTGNLNIIGLIISILLIVGILFMLFKPYKEANKLTKKVKI